MKFGGRIDTTPPPTLLHGTYGGVALLPQSRSRHPLRVRAADRRQPVVPKLKVWSRLPAVQLSVLPGPVSPSLERSAARPASEHDPRCRRAAESGARPSRRRRRPNLLGSPSRTRLPADTAPATARLTTNCEAINDARACAATGPQYPRLCAAAPATIASYQRRTRLGQRLRTRLPAGWPCRRLAGSAPQRARRWCARTYAGERCHCTREGPLDDALRSYERCAQVSARGSGHAAAVPITTRSGGDRGVLDSVALDLTSMIVTDSLNSQRLVPLPV